MWLLDSSAYYIPEDLRSVYAGGRSTTAAFVLRLQRENRDWRRVQAEPRILVHKLSIVKSKIRWEGVEMS